jgi:hypothetical protein
MLFNRVALQLAAWGSVVALAMACVEGATGRNQLVEQRREQLEQMTATQREALRSKQERFAKLEPRQQESLRELHRQIDEHPQRERLQGVLHRYHEWRKSPSLLPSDRAQLAQMSLDERIGRVRELQQQQQREYLARAGRKLDNNDVDAIVQWFHQYVAANEAKIIELLPERERNRVAEDDRMRRFTAHMMAAAGRIPPLEEADYGRLAERLSAEARRVLERSPTEDRPQLITSWVRTAFQARSFVRGSRHRNPWGRSGGQLDQAELKKILDLLPPEQRERLYDMDRDEMMRQLTRIYFERRQDRERERDDSDGSRSERSGGDQRAPRDGPPRSRGFDGSGGRQAPSNGTSPSQSDAAPPPSPATDAAPPPSPATDAAPPADDASPADNTTPPDEAAPSPAPDGAAPAAS